MLNSMAFFWLQPRQASHALRTCQYTVLAGQFLNLCTRSKLNPDRHAIHTLQAL